jgi:photosystem II stability/assembly factor-like uncharacterized protein
VRRDAFAGGTPTQQTGPSGGLFKSTDAGKTWVKLAGGLPDRAIGRCGIALFRKDPRIVYAVVQTDKTQFGPLGQQPKAGDDASLGGVFRSDDAGKTWKKVNDLAPRPFYYGKLRVDPNNHRRVYVLGVNLFVSSDAGEEFAPRLPPGVHADQHTLWINPANTDHLILGNDGGLYVSKDRGRTFEMKRSLAIGQFYGVAVDNLHPYHVVGGLQDNGSWSGPVATPYPDGITIADWSRVAGADGFQCAYDAKDPFTVYVEGQFGGILRVNLLGERGPVPKPIRPPFAKGEPPYRTNWNTPFCLSPHESKTMYYGAQHLYKSTNRGDSWTQISTDLTRAPKGLPVVNFGHTLSTVAESPVKPGTIWAGTDDGKVWVTKDDGKEWSDVGRAVESGSPLRWISKIEPSHFDAASAFLSIDRHRNDDFKPYIYKTADYGATWTPISSGLPVGAVVCVIRQSSKHKDLLFAGTERGLYATLDGGKNWHHLNKTGLPANVRIDDLVIHSRERELVVGTHGRSLWLIDISPLEQMTDAVLASESHLFEVKPVTFIKGRPRRTEPPKGLAAKNPPDGLRVNILTSKKGGATVTAERVDGQGDAFVWHLAETISAGFHSHCFDIKQPGEYRVTLKISDKVIATRTASVKPAE